MKNRFVSILLAVMMLFSCFAGMVSAEEANVDEWIATVEHVCIDTLVFHEKVEPTCTSSGTEAYWECSVCHKLFTIEEEIDEDKITEDLLIEIEKPVMIPAKGHVLVAHESEEAGTYWLCEICNAPFSDGEGLEPAEQLAADPAVVAEDEAEKEELAELPGDVEPESEEAITPDTDEMPAAGEEPDELEEEKIPEEEPAGQEEEAPVTDGEPAAPAEPAQEEPSEPTEEEAPVTDGESAVPADNETVAVDETPAEPLQEEESNPAPAEDEDSVTDEEPAEPVDNEPAIDTEPEELVQEEQPEPAEDGMPAEEESSEPADVESSVPEEAAEETTGGIPVDEEKASEPAEESETVEEPEPVGVKETAQEEPVVYEEEEVPSLVKSDDNIILLSANVEFDGLIHLLFKYNIKNCNSSAWNSTFVVFTIGNEKLASVALKDGTKVASNNADDEIYTYSCPVPIVYFTDTINIKVVNSSGNELPTRTGKGVVVKGGYNYSLYTYAKNKSTSSNAKMADLAKALQDYGVATRTYAGKSTDGLTLSSAITSLSVESMKVNETGTSGTKPNGVSASQNVIFESDNSLQITFSLGSSNYVFKQDGKTITPSVSGGKAVLMVANIAPDHLNEKHSFSISDGTNTFTVETSVLGYAKRKALTGSSSMKDLAKALYVYAKAAAAYSHTDFTPEEDFEMNDAGGTITITKYKGDSSSVNIPEKINDKPVQSIASNAFDGNKKIEEVILPQSVKTIGASAFKGCSALKEIEIPDSVEEIGAEAFANCSGLTAFDYPTSLKTVGENVFKGCSGIKTIAVPEGITELPDNMFFGADCLVTVQLPDSLKIIGAYSFSKCTFTTITLPDGVEVIEKGAFKDCTKLAEMKVR